MPHCMCRYLDRWEPGIVTALACPWLSSLLNRAYNLQAPLPVEVWLALACVACTPAQRSTARGCSSEAVASWHITFMHHLQESPACTCRARATAQHRSQCMRVVPIHCTTPTTGPASCVSSGTVCVIAGPLCHTIEPWLGCGEPRRSGAARCLRDATCLLPSVFVP